jgi:glycosyltransferase involved in cell wall biosynthesis
MAALAAPYAANGIELRVAYLHERQPNVRSTFERSGATTVLIDEARLGRVRTALELSDAVRAFRPDLVHTVLFESDVFGRLSAAKARTPVVSSVVNESYGPEHRADPRVNAIKLGLVQAADAATARLTRRLHALTHSTADIMARRLRYPRRRIDVVGRGRDPDALGVRTPERHTRARVSLGIAPAETLLIAAARLEYQKGLDVLVRAMPAVRTAAPNARLVIAGRAGGQSAELEQLVADLDVADVVRFLGAREDVPDLLAGADVFVVPSRREGFGSVLLEAMALEAPIVASDIAPLVEVLSGTGRLFASEDEQSLAQAIVASIEDHDRTRGLVATARERFLDHYTVDSIATQMRSFYERALEGR